MYFINVTDLKILSGSTIRVYIKKKKQKKMTKLTKTNLKSPRILNSRIGLLNFNLFLKIIIYYSFSLHLNC